MRPHGSDLLKADRLKAGGIKPGTWALKADATCSPLIVVVAPRGESPASHRGQRGAPPTRRDDRKYREIFEGGATQSAAGVPAARFPARWGGAGMHRRPNAAGVSPRAARPPGP